MDAPALFSAVIRECREAGAFASMAPREEPSWAHSGADIRMPAFEGDFATSTDASFLLAHGVPVPQAAMNATRLSVSRALEKVMPDWAVTQWMELFLREAEAGHLAAPITTLALHTLPEMPRHGRWPEHDFDYRIGTQKDKGAVFSKDDAARGQQALLKSPWVIAGILLWQHALEHYAAGLRDAARKDETLPEPLRARLTGFCTFLCESAFRLASFGALLPLAIVTALQDGGKEKSSCPFQAGHGIATFGEKGGFIKTMYMNIPQAFRRWLATTFPVLRRKEQPPLSHYEANLGLLLRACGQKRVGVCAANDALMRWAGLSLREGNGQRECLDRFIDKAQIWMAQHPSWKDLEKLIMRQLSP